MFQDTYGVHNMKKVITQKQTNILSNNFYRGWHNSGGVKTPFPSDRITTEANLGSHSYEITINLDGIALVGQTYCLPQEVIDDIANFCNELHAGAYLQLNINLLDAPSGFNFSHYFGETSRDIHPSIFMRHSTDVEDSNFWAPVLHIYDEPADTEELTYGTVAIFLTTSNSCTLDIATCGPIINVHWGW